MSDQGCPPRSSRFAAFAGFHPIVVDPRASFADPDYVVVISNDPKIDEPALAIALAADPAYVGAIGSRHKQEDRRASLLASGVSEERLRDLNAPIGLDLAGNEPAELGLRWPRAGAPDTASDCSSRLRRSTRHPDGISPGSAGMASTDRSTSCSRVHQVINETRITPAPRPGPPPNQSVPSF